MSYKLLCIALIVIFQQMPNVTIHQDSAITKLLEEKIEGISPENKTTDGYRIQIYSSNQQQQAKTEALQQEKWLQEHISEPIYVVYTAPFWKVRVGDYLTIEEAQVAKEELLHKLPQLQSSTYVVRDKIQVRE